MTISRVSWLFLTLYYSACLSFHVSQVSSLCLDEQKLLLLQLKKDLIFDSTYSSKLVFWNDSVPCIRWSGVTWDDEGHVVVIDLSGESISGGFDNSSSLFNLEYLKNLNLANNHFNSVIPSRIGNLKNLTSLNLSDAGFVKQIPAEISQLTRLAILDISVSYALESGLDLKLEDPNFVMLVQNLNEVRELYLDGVWISLEGNKWGLALSSSLPYLQVLSMSNCNLLGPIDSSLEMLKNLSIINLNGNNLSAPMPEFFARFSNLTYLDLSSCGLSQRVPKEIFQVQSLNFLDLSYNDGLQGSLPHFPQNGSLQVLKLAETNFSGALPDSLSNLQQLSVIDFSRCQFNGTVPYSISHLTELTYLDMSYNNFTGPTPPFGVAKKLRFIDLSNNKFSGPLSLSSLPSLETIDLSNNKFSGPLSLPSLPSLETIDLSNNHFEGPIPQSIFHLKTLLFLRLFSNQFNGTVHLDMIWRLGRLDTLDLSNNNLSVDATVKDAHRFSFPKMTKLYLASCKLRKFPAFLRNQSGLVDLDLSNNQISGRIPSWIWEIGHLSRLNLSYNSFQEIERLPLNHSIDLGILDFNHNNLEGTLPTFPKSASYLDYSFNNFYSSIPLDIGNYLSSIIFLSLSHNALHGKIPDSICNTSYAFVLDLSFNNFEGMIPHCLAKSVIYGVLNLGENNLGGSIPDTFQASCALLTLDLHNNNLQGPIPKSLSNCSSLEVLNLGNNRIDDRFPCFLMKLSKLRVLVLRKNKFHGPIVCPKMKGTWEMLQIVDLAFNNFNGILPGKSFLNWKAMMLDEEQTALKLSDLHIELLKFELVHPENWNPMNYRDKVTITNKGQQMTLNKILTIFTYTDFSSNCFEGSIPEEMMEFRALHLLNLSSNNLSGHIPSSIGKMKQLESFDLSNNSFTGEIPSQLASLSFLEVLNLSYNHLSGEIPTGTQIQSFPASSFIGNRGLCGPPLSKNCSGNRSSSTNAVYTKSGFGFDWRIGSSGVVFGLGIIIGPLFYWKQWRIRYWKLVDNILCGIFPQLYHEYEWHEGQTYTVLHWRH